MKKLLSAVSAITLVSTSTITVVACSSNANFKEFESWINNKESFLLYIGADDCEYCIQFENAIDNENNYVENKLNKMSTDYTNLHTGNVYEDSLTAFGEKLTNDKPVDFRTFKTEEKANNFTEKWSENIIKWVVDQVTEIYYNNKIAPNINSNEAYRYKKIAKEKVQKYFDSNKGTPFFLLIRNGKLVNWSMGFENDSLGWDTNSLDKLFNPLVDDFLNSEIESTIVNKIEDNSSGSNESGSDGESSTGGEETTSSLKENNLNYNSNLSLYSNNFDLEELLNQYNQT